MVHVLHHSETLHLALFGYISLLQLGDRVPLMLNIPVCAASLSLLFGLAFDALCKLVVTYQLFVKVLNLYSDGDVGVGSSAGFIQIPSQTEATTEARQLVNKKILGLSTRKPWKSCQA